ncbi:MAG: hypothetical protein WKF84_20145 [Pyrinomonadaceae bacterium]
MAGELDSNQPQARIAFAVAVLIGAVLLARGVSATNFERGLDNHEPMFFAHTTEAFRTVSSALEQNRDRKDWIWIDGTYQWPMAWYLRDSGGATERRYGGASKRRSGQRGSDEDGRRLCAEV